MRYANEELEINDCTVPLISIAKSNMERQVWDGDTTKTNCANRNCYLGEPSRMGLTSWCERDDRPSRFFNSFIVLPHLPAAHSSELLRISQVRLHPQEVEFGQENRETHDLVSSTRIGFWVHSPFFSPFWIRLMMPVEGTLGKPNDLTLKGHIGSSQCWHCKHVAHAHAWQSAPEVELSSLNGT
jgi:hypothetical protein